MPWGANIGILAGAGQKVVVFTTNQTDLNLWDYFGNPAAPSTVDVTFNGMDANTLFIGAWPAGTVLTILLTNGARILGRGGVGGDGADVISTGGGSGTNNTPQVPGNGNAGGRAFDAGSTTASIQLNADNGFILGGGGGGGGGGGAGRNTGGQGQRRGGGGGGGGQGWQNAAGGPGGDVWNHDSPDGTAGSAGSTFTPGTGGGSGMPAVPPPSALDGGGGDGGSFGVAGLTGEDATETTAIGGAGWNGGLTSGVAGGAAGASIYAPTAVVTFTGALNEAALVAALRLLGPSTHL